jgi:hypothetical protein
MVEKTRKTTGHPLKPHDATRGPTSGRTSLNSGTKGLTQTIDPSVTRLAVELLNPEFHASAMVIEGCLQSLRELLSVDAVMALLFDDDSQVIQQAIISSGPRLAV